MYIGNVQVCPCSKKQKQKTKTKKKKRRLKENIHVIIPRRESVNRARLPMQGASQNYYTQSI